MYCGVVIVGSQDLYFRRIACFTVNFRSRSMGRYLLLTWLYTSGARGATDYYVIIMWYYFGFRQDAVDANGICSQSSVEYKYSNDFDTLHIVIDRASFVPQSHIRHAKHTN